MNKYYTGIGSRQTPRDIQIKMSLIATELCNRNYILRSGGAEGADKAFENGVYKSELKEIYLPWKGFNGSESPLYLPKGSQQHGITLLNKGRALEIASTIHPAWGNCSDAAKKLHTRNIFQVLGLQLDTPSDFLICWTLDGKISGGTATAIKLAIQNEVKVINLADSKYSSMKAYEIVSEAI